MDSRRSEKQPVGYAEGGLLRQYAFLDATCTTALKELAQLAARLCHAPIAAINLIDQDRQWFKAVVGLDTRQLGRGFELCRRVVEQRRPIVLSQLSAAEAVAGHPQLQSFAGMPLLNQHPEPLGTLFVADSQSREFTPEQQEVLRLLAGQVVAQLELGRKLHHIEQSEAVCLISERGLREQNLLLQLQQHVAAAANEAGSASEALQAGLELIGEHTGWPVGHVYVLADANDDAMVSAGIWSVPDRTRFAEFCRSTSGTQLSTGIGLTGQVLASGRPLLVNQLDTNDEFRRAAAARDCGLVQGYFFPIMYGGHAVGIMEFFNDRVVQIDDQLLAVVNYTGQQLGQAIGRERANQALLQSERRFRDLFESSPDAVVVQNLQGQILDVSPAACRLLNAGRDWLISRNILEFIPPDARARAALFLPQLVRAELDFIEGECLAKTGEITPIEVRANRIDYAGQPAVLLHVRNTTERKRLEQQFLQAQRAEAIGQLAGGVAHDFNNILTIIMGYSEMSLLRPDVGEALRRSLEEIEKAGFRGANLTRQLLAFSRRQVLQPQVIDLNVVVADIDRMLRRLIGENIELVTNLQPGLGSIKADPSQIEQVLMNLAVNARDAMPDGGSLIIATADRQLTVPVAEQYGEIPTGRYVTVTVTDTGCGMTSDVLEHMFEPFFTTKPVGKGTGLGLATCFGIMKQSGGHIAVTSTVGCGTRFCLYLPTVAEEAGTLVPPRPTEDETRPHGTETLLLVEDDEMVRELAAETLRELGYTILPADNGEAALQLVREPRGKKIDLVITDVVMPQRSGRELVDSILSTNEQMRILFVSGYTDDEIVPQGILRPGVEFLQKPYTGTALAKKVRDMLDSPCPARAAGTGS